MTYTEVKLQQKLTYLRRLLNVRVKLMKFAQSVDVIQNKDTIVVRWNVFVKERFFDFEEKEFPTKDIQKMIAYYKRKIGTEFKNRHKSDQQN